MREGQAERSALIVADWAVSGGLADRASPVCASRAVVVDGDAADSVVEGTSGAGDGRSRGAAGS